MSNSDIKSSLGLGIVRFEEQPEEPEISTYDYEYRTNTEVITAVEVSGGQSDPDDPVTVRFHIDGTTYTVSNVYYPGRRFPIGLGTLDYTGRAAGHDHRCGCIRPRISTGHHPL